MIEAAKSAEVVLMVGYPKRYDPAFAQFRETVAAFSEPRLFRVTTTESPFQPYVSQYGLRPPSTDVDETVLAGLRADTRSRLVAAIGTDDEFLVEQYQNVLLDTLVHEINTTRGAGRTGPSRLRRPAPRFVDRRAALWRRDGGHSLGRCARYDPLLNGVHDDVR